MILQVMQHRCSGFSASSYQNRLGDFQFNNTGMEYELTSSLYRQDEED